MEDEEKNGTIPIETEEEVSGKVSEPEEKKSPGFLAGIVIGLGCGALVLIVVLVCQNVLKSEEHARAQDSLLNDEAQQTVSEIEKVIEANYYDYKDDPIDDDTLRDGLYRGIVEGLDDPYSQYFTKEELDDKIEEDQGVYYGIGAYLAADEETGYTVIAGVMDDSPAQEAGLEAGDILYKIDGESGYGLSTDDVVSKIRGEKGTTVHLSVYREGEDDYLEIDVIRDEITSLSVASQMLDDKIGYIGISSFEGATVDQFTEQYEELRSEGAEALILDLRGNTGGLLNSVLKIARQILPEGLIVYTENKYGVRTNFECDGANEIDIPLVVLVNGYSASSSEILAGAIKDYGIGTLVGTQTFGKGIVQDTYMLSDGSAVKLTCEAYYTPNGNNIQGTGIEPDVVLEFDADAYYDDGTDNQLEKAIEILKGEE